MNYWMICLPREDMEHCIKKGIFGATRRGSLKDAKKGDFPGMNKQIQAAKLNDCIKVVKLLWSLNPSGAFELNL